MYYTFTISSSLCRTNFIAHKSSNTLSFFFSLFSSIFPLPCLLKHSRTFSFPHSIPPLSPPFTSPSPPPALRLSSSSFPPKSPFCSDLHLPLLSRPMAPPLSCTEHLTNAGYYALSLPEPEFAAAAATRGGEAGGGVALAPSDASSPSAAPAPSDAPAPSSSSSPSSPPSSSTTLDSRVMSKVDAILTDYHLSPFSKQMALQFLQKMTTDPSADFDRVKAWLLRKMNKTFALPASNSPWQKGCPEIIPHLTAQPVWPSSAFSWIPSFEASFPVILEELEALREREGKGLFQPYRAPSRPGQCELEEKKRRSPRFFVYSVLSFSHKFFFFSSLSLLFSSLLFQPLPPTTSAPPPLPAAPGTSSTSLSAPS